MSGEARKQCDDRLSAASLSVYVRKVYPWRFRATPEIPSKSVFFTKTGLTGGQSARVLPIRGKCERIRDNDITRSRTFERGSACRNCICLTICRANRHMPPSIRHEQRKVSSKRWQTSWLDLYSCDLRGGILAIRLRRISFLYILSEYMLSRMPMQ